MAGTLHLSNEIYPVLQDSVVISAFTKHWNDILMKYEHKSGHIYADPAFNGNTALHTVAFYLTNYRGTVYIEGTLDNSPSQDTSYAVLYSKEHDGTNGVDYANFNGVYSHIRIRHVPAQGLVDMDNDNPAYYGSFDKALYRS
jgi:hypothetical protein